MRERWTAVGQSSRALLAAAMVAAAYPAAAANPVVQPPFADDYTVVALGQIPGVHAPYGAISFGLGTANRVIVGGWAGTANALLQVVDLTRDVTGSISGFAGAPSTLAETPGATGGATYGPENVLFYPRSTLEIGQVKPGSTTTDKVVSTRSVTPYWRPSGLAFVPPGFPGAGQLKLTTFNTEGDWWSLAIAPDGTGTYDLTGATRGPALPGFPYGFTYVPAGLPDFPNSSVVVCEYANAYAIGKLTAYDVDQNGNPILATRREIVTGLDVPYGIATDPLTGDLLWTSYTGFVFHLRKSPIPTTTTTLAPTTTSTTSTTTTLVPTTTTSTTLRPTTSSTVAPTTSTTTTSSTTSTTSSTSTSSTTSPSTTAVPTTSTTSTTARPTTTSTMIPPTTTSSTSTTAPRPTTSTTTSSTSTSTTIPTACTSQPSWTSLACRLVSMLELVRASGALGPLQPVFVARFERAQDVVADGAEQCAAGQLGPARQALQRVQRQMSLIRARTRTLRARRIIPPPLAAAIAEGARDIGADAGRLRDTLTCPWLP